MDANIALTRFKNRLKFLLANRVRAASSIGRAMDS